MDLGNLGGRLGKPREKRLFIAASGNFRRFNDLSFGPRPSC
jgi:hypothetical protein